MCQESMKSLCMDYLPSSSPKHRVIFNVVITCQMRKLRHREVKQLSLGCTAVAEVGCKPDRIHHAVLPWHKKQLFGRRMNTQNSLLEDSGILLQPPLLLSQISGECRVRDDVGGAPELAPPHPHSRPPPSTPPGFMTLQVQSWADF